MIDFQKFYLFRNDAQKTRLAENRFRWTFSARLREVVQKKV